MDNKELLQGKKEKVLNSRSKFSSTSVLILLIVAAMVGGGFFLAQNQGKYAPPPPKKVDRLSVSDPLNYADKRYDMATINVTEDANNIIIPLKAVKKNRIVSFMAKSSGVVIQESNFGRRELPLMAYISPSGSLVTAVSYCEPCRSIYFYTETDMSLTCQVCGTKWNLESLQGIGGACVSYPPPEIKARVANGNIYLKKSDIRAWKPRKTV